MPPIAPSARGVPLGRAGAASPIQLVVRVGRVPAKQAAAGAGASLRSEMARAAYAAAKSVADEARRRAPTDEGALRAAIRPAVRLAGDTASPLVSINLPYAANVELGRRPGARMPPVGALVGWVQRKLGVSAKAARGVAFAVARKIARRGIRGVHMLRDAVRAKAPETRARFKGAVVSWARRRFGRLA